MKACKHVTAIIASGILEGSIYKHTKSGKEYAIVDAGHFRDANSGEFLIAYKDATTQFGQIWMHRLSEFTKLNEDGSKRFELVTRSMGGRVPACLNLN